MKSCNCKCDGSCKPKKLPDPIDPVIHLKPEVSPAPAAEEAEALPPGASPPSDDLLH